MKGFLRKDGRMGIRNIVLVAYLVECAHYVATEIVRGFDSDKVHLIGFSGCAPNAYASRMMSCLCTHPNVGAVLLVSLGCENMNREKLLSAINDSGRQADVIVIQQCHGTRTSISKGQTIVKQMIDSIARQQRVAMNWHDLVVGTICGGSDAMSGISANPVVGLTFDKLSELGVTCIFEEPGELIGCEDFLKERAVNSKVGDEAYDCIVRADRYYKIMGHDSFSEGNAEGGLTTIEEKSLGSYCKSGSKPLKGVIRPTERPHNQGLYLMDVIPQGEAKWGFPNINDSSEIMELASCGCQIILFTTGRGSVVGASVVTVIKICSNPVTYRNMEEDMDINAGRIIEGKTDLHAVSDELIKAIERVACGERTKSEQLGHHECCLTYK